MCQSLMQFGKKSWQVQLSVKYMIRVAREDILRGKNKKVVAAVHITWLLE